MTAISHDHSATNVTQEDLQAILDSLAEGVVTLDDRRRITGINRAACGILEVERGEAVGADCCELMARQLGESGAQLRDSIRDGRPARGVPVRVRTRFGRAKVLVLHTDLLRGGEGARGGSVVVLGDVTELAALKEDLARRYRLERIAGKSKLQTRVEPSDVGPEAVRETLAATGWNVSKAARRLRVSRTTLYKRIARLGIRRPEE